MPTFDSRWKNPQGSSLQQMYLWAQDLIKELRRGSFLDFIAGDIDEAIDAAIVDQVATVAQVRAASTGNRILVTSLLETASAPVALSVVANPVAVNWDAAINFTATLTANRTLSLPTNVQLGTWRAIFVNGNDATPRTLSFAAGYQGADLTTLTDITNGKGYLVSMYGRTTGNPLVSFLPTS